MAKFNHVHVPEFPVPAGEVGKMSLGEIRVARDNIRFIDNYLDHTLAFYREGQMHPQQRRELESLRQRLDELKKKLNDREVKLRSQMVSRQSYSKEQWEFIAREKLRQLKELEGDLPRRHRGLKAKPVIRTSFRKRLYDKLVSR